MITAKMNAENTTQMTKIMVKEGTRVKEAQTQGRFACQNPWLLERLHRCVKLEV